MGDNCCVTSRLADILPLELRSCSLYTMGESIQVMFYELRHFVYIYKTEFVYLKFEFGQAYPVRSITKTRTFNNFF